MTRARLSAHNLQEEDKERFLQALGAGLSVTAAAQAAGRHPTTFYRHAEADEEFADAWREASEKGTDRLEDEALKRAIGWKKPRYNAEGSVEGYIHENSDLLLIFLLKARRPEKFNPDSRLDITSSDGALHAFAQAMRVIEGEAEIFNGESAEVSETRARLSHDGEATIRQKANGNGSVDEDGDN